MRASSDGCGCFPTGKHYPGIAHLLRTEAAGVADELGAEGNWVDIPIALLDTETTGREAENDRIVEVGIIIGQSGVVQRRYNWLINPGVPIPKAASDVHGISDDDVRDKPSFADVADEIWEVLRGAIPAAYNAAFDRAFLRAEMRRAGRLKDGPDDQAPPALRNGVEWLDPLVWSRAIHRQELPADIDRGIAADLLIGPLYWRLVVLGRRATREEIRELARKTAAALRSA